MESPQLKLLFNNHVDVFSNLTRWWQSTNPGCPFSNTISHPTPIPYSTIAEQDQLQPHQPSSLHTYNVGQNHHNHPCRESLHGASTPHHADTPQIPRAARCLATAVSQSDPAGPSKPRRFPKLDDGLTFGDFASGQELPTERVVLGNTSQ